MNNLISTQCAICQTDCFDRVVVSDSLQAKKIKPELFSPRRTPDQNHYQMVVCQRCGLVRANPVLPESAIDNYYSLSGDRDDQLEQYAAKTYYRYFCRFFSSLPRSSRILEVGCGNGNFIKKLLNMKYKDIHGIEPSKAAAAQAIKVTDNIHIGVLSSGIYPSRHFDLVCAFHVFDHVLDPRRFLEDCNNILKPDRYLMLILHDLNAFSVKIMGARSPVIDIEHPFLYNKYTLKVMLGLRGFKVERFFSVCNSYPLRYWIQLFPMGKPLRDRVLRTVRNMRLESIPLSISAGNLGVIARKINE